jgi:hypothetical protein
MTMKNGHHCAQNQVCVIWEISDCTSLKFWLMKLEKKLRFGISFQKPSMSSMKFV